MAAIKFLRKTSLLLGPALIAAAIAGWAVDWIANTAGLIVLALVGFVLTGIGAFDKAAEREPKPPAMFDIDGAVINSNISDNVTNAPVMLRSKGIYRSWLRRNRQHGD